MRTSASFQTNVFERAVSICVFLVLSVATLVGQTAGAEASQVRAHTRLAQSALTGKDLDTAEKEFKLPKYENLAGYANGQPFVARRYCGLWGRGT